MSPQTAPMSNPRTLKLIIAALLITQVVSLGFIVQNWAKAKVQNLQWEAQVYGDSGMAGTLKAMSDFQNGKLRILEIQGANDHLKYSGKTDGVFEIWVPQFYPSLGHPHQLATETYVKFYNSKMRYMHEHPDDFVGKEKAAKADSRQK